MKMIRYIPLCLFLIIETTLASEADRLALKNAYKSSFCEAIYGGTLDATTHECTIKNAFTHKNYTFKNIYHFWKQQLPPQEYYNDLIKQLQAGTSTCPTQNSFSADSMVENAKGLLCDLTKHMYKDELSNLALLFKNKTPPSFNFVSGNVLFPFLPLMQPTVTVLPSNPVIETTNLIIAKRKKKSSQVYSRFEIANRIVDNISQPLFIVDKFNKVVLKPLDAPTVEQRMGSLFGAKEYSSCITQAGDVKDPISSKNAYAYCHFLKRTGSQDNKKTLSNFIQLLSLNTALILNIDGCLGKDMLQTKYKVMPNLQSQKRGHFIYWTTHTTNPITNKPQVKTKYFKMGCITKFSSNVDKKLPPSKSSLNGFYQLILNFDRLLKTSKELIASVPQLETHPAIQILKEYQTNFDRFKINYTAAKSLPASSTLTPLNVKPFLMNIQSIAVRLEPYLNPFIMEWVAKELRTAQFPNSISSENLYGTAKYGNEYVFDNMSERLDCDGTINIDKLEKLNPIDPNSKYTLELINSYINDLSETDNVPSFPIYPIDTDKNYAKVIPLSDSKHITVLAAGHLLPFKVDDKWVEIVYKNKTVKYKVIELQDKKLKDGTTIKVPKTVTKEKQIKVPVLKSREGPRYKSLSGDFITPKNNTEITSIPDFRLATFKKILKKSSDYISDSQAFIHLKVLSMSAIQYQASSRSIVYKGKCGSKDILVTPMQVLKHNSTYRLGRDWQALIAVSTNDAFLLQEMNKILAEKRYMEYILNRQQDQLIAVSNAMISTNQSSIAENIKGQKGIIVNDMDSYLKGQSRSDNKSQQLTGAVAKSSSITQTDPP